MKKNILQLIPSFNQGGSERQALQLARLLYDDGTYNVRLACLNKSGVLLDDDVIDRFADIPEFSLNSFYDVNFLKQVWRFSGWLRANNIEILQTHDFYSNIFGMAGAGIAGVPLRIAAKREMGMRTRSQNFVERRAFGHASVVVVNSEGVRRYLLDAGVPHGKLKLIYNGIDLGRFDADCGDRASLLEGLGLPIDPAFQFVTIVANLREKVKNHEMFFRSAKKVADRFPDAVFIVAGEGERSGLIKAYAEELGLGSRAIFLGRCSRIPELLAVSSVCVLSSDSEGFSNSILEYMAAGKPVVATNVGGAAEVIRQGENGFLIEPNDDAAMADRIVELLEQPAVAEAFGKCGKQRIAEQFSTRNQLGQTLDLYQGEFMARGRSI